MHTEHLNNVRLGYVLAGWAIAICATSLFVLVLIATGIQSSMSSDGRYIAAAVALGFAMGGAFVGFMTSLAPILHGIMIGLTSLVVWALYQPHQPVDGSGRAGADPGRDPGRAPRIPLHGGPNLTVL
jgi:hypothetical protein